jgi:hypothetical protein
MNRIGVAILALMSASGAAMAASAINLDSEPRTIVVTEGSSRSELVIGAGEAIEFCPTGCFVTMPNGDREVLTGNETLEISDGKGRLR